MFYYTNVRLYCTAIVYYCTTVLLCCTTILRGRRILRLWPGGGACVAGTFFFCFCTTLILCCSTILYYCTTVLLYYEDVAFSAFGQAAPRTAALAAARAGQMTAGRWTTAVGDGTVEAFAREVSCRAVAPMLRAYAHLRGPREARLHCGRSRRRVVVIGAVVFGFGRGPWSES